jgi:ribosomal protein L7/L12
MTTAEDHLARATELLDMGLRVTRDTSLSIPERDRRLAELEAAEEQTEFDVLLEDRAAEKQGAWFEQVNR